MTSIIRGILGSTVGLLLNKARDSVANKLKDGGLTDQQLREIIVRDLSDIKTKLDCLSLKDLDSSYSFLKEGVGWLNHALDKSSIEGQVEATRISNDSTSGILNAALSLPEAIQRLKISSEERFISAKDCFKEARKDATHAFNNKSLSIKDRIMACKLRVAARILQSGLEDPEAATKVCLLSLEELHGLPAIQDMFSVYLNGGLRSKLNKAERLENIMSILSINHALFDFAVKYSSQYPNVFTWPGIVLTGRTFNPILNTPEILPKTPSEELLQQLNQTFDIPCSWSSDYFAVNSRGEIIEFHLPNDNIIILYTTGTGESKSVVFPDAWESSLVINIRRTPRAVAVDSDDNVYVVCCLATSREQNRIDFDYVLYVLDENYNFKLCRKLDFGKENPEFGEYDAVRIAVDKNIIMIKEDDNQVYVWDKTGQLKFKFKLDSRVSCHVCSLIITSKNDIMIPSRDRHTVNLYTEEGTLKSTIKVPEGHNVCEVAFHHGMCKIIVLTNVKEQDSCFLLCYSETGDLENSVFFCKLAWAYTAIENHSCGLLAIRLGRIITFI